MQDICNVARENSYDWSGEIKSDSCATKFLAGILRHLPALLALTCPTRNSFRRLVCTMPIARAVRSARRVLIFYSSPRHLFDEMLKDEVVVPPLGLTAAAAVPEWMNRTLQQTKHTNHTVLIGSRCLGRSMVMLGH